MKRRTRREEDDNHDGQLQMDLNFFNSNIHASTFSWEKIVMRYKTLNYSSKEFNRVQQETKKNLSFPCFFFFYNCRQKIPDLTWTNNFELWKPDQESAGMQPYCLVVR